MRLTALAMGWFGCAMLLPVARAQTVGFTPRKDADRIPSYEVVSIRKSQDGNGTPRGIHEDPDGLTAGATSLRSLIGEAYGFGLGQLNDQELEGAPGWAKTELFDVHAKVDSADVAKLKELSKAETMMVSVQEIVSRTPGFRMVMLQRLLEDRFRLKVHYEQRVMPLYEMTVAKGGVRMKIAHPADPEHGSFGFIDGKQWGLKAENVPMAFIPVIFAMELERPVEDKTSTDANFDFELHYARMSTPAGNNADDSAPSLFTAVQEQLGLKLQAGKGPVWVIVVDRAEMPSEN
jgi:uncharacterized protein (TIGR03435 family)